MLLQMMGHLKNFFLTNTKMIIVSYISLHYYAHANTLYHNDMMFSTRAIPDIYHIIISPFHIFLPNIRPADRTLFVKKSSKKAWNSESWFLFHNLPVSKHTQSSQFLHWINFTWIKSIMFSSRTASLLTSYRGLFVQCVQASELTPLVNM